MKISKIFVVIFCATTLLTAHAEYTDDSDELSPELEEILSEYASSITLNTKDLSELQAKKLEVAAKENTMKHEKKLRELPDPKTPAEFEKHFLQYMHAFDNLFLTTQQLIDIDLPLPAITRLSITGKKYRTKVRIYLLQMTKESMLREAPHTTDSDIRSLLPKLERQSLKEQRILAGLELQEADLLREGANHQEEEMAEDQTWKELEEIMMGYCTLLEEQHLFHRDQEKLEEIMKNNLEYFHNELIAAYHSHMVNDEEQFRVLLQSLSKAVERILPTEEQLVGAGICREAIGELVPASEMAVVKIKQHIFATIQKHVKEAGPDSHSHKWYVIATDELRLESMKIEKAMAFEAEAMEEAIEDEEQELVDHLFDSFDEAMRSYEETISINLPTEDAKKLKDICSEKASKIEKYAAKVSEDPEIDSRDELKHLIAEFMRIIEELVPTKQDMTKAGMTPEAIRMAVHTGVMFELQAKYLFFDALLGEIPREDTELYEFVEEEIKQHKKELIQKELEGAMETEAMKIAAKEGGAMKKSMEGAMKKAMEGAMKNDEWKEEGEGKNVFARQCLTIGTFGMLMAFAARMF